MSDRRLFEHELAERLDQVLFASPSHRSIEHLAASLEALTRVKQEKVLQWAAVAARTYAEIGYLIASLAVDAFARLSDDEFDAWVIAGLDCYDREGLRPAMELLRDISGFVASRAGRTAARLVDVEDRLTRFLHGLSGRPLEVRAGSPAWTDTESIYLPTSIAEHGVAADNRRAYKAVAALLWAQTRYGTFSADIDAAIASIGDRPQALAWLALLEAVRLEARIAADLPGLAREMAQLRGPWPAQLAPTFARLQHPDATVDDSLALLGQFVGRGPPPTLPLVGTLDPTSAKRLRAERIARETRILRKALAVLQRTGSRPEGVAARLDVAAGESGWLDVSIDGEVVALPVEARAAAQSLVQDLGGLPPELLSPAGPGQWAATDGAGPGPTLADDREADCRYDEWDHHRRAYRKGWCHVYELDVRPGEPGYVDGVRQRYRAQIGQIRRRFEAVRGEDRIIGRQPDGDEVDVDALVDAHLDRKIGIEPSARLFCRRIRNERSLAALFMVDMSGSTKGWVNDAEREALVMLCEAIETLGDDYAIYGFSGWTRTRCDIYRIKAFGEAYGEGVRGRIAGIEAKDYTRMGVAIRHLTGLLARRPVRHRLLVTLSDGRPDDFGDEYRGSYGIEDTRQALLEARRLGVRSYCVTIDRRGADYLRRMYGPAAYTVLDQPGKLPGKLADIYRRLTAN